jgi:tripartite-type tricarboxylate transporter receptor subunit TctC
MTEPEVAQKMAALGFEKIASTPDEFARRIRADIPKWAKVIQTANIRVE